MKLPYTHLSLDERRELFRLHSAQIPMRVIAQRLNRHPSTLYREVKRNWFYDQEPLYRGSFHVAADMQARAWRQRRARYQHKPRGLFIPAGNTIEERPAEIADRTSFGHWECDLMMFCKEFGKHNFTSLLESQSRYIILTRNRDRNSTVSGALDIFL
jgi:IS30 family transposase